MSQDEQNVKPTESELKNTQASSLESSGSAQEPGNSASESNPSCSNNSGKLILITVLVFWNIWELNVKLLIIEFPRILSRQEWGARDPVNPLVDLNRAVDFVVIHHSSRPRCFTMEDCIRAVRSYQDLHMDANKWDDIGYSFVVGEDGNVYEGRGWNKHGAHSIPFNRNSIGTTKSRLNLILKDILFWFLF